MKFLINLFKPQYKIVGTYDVNSKRNGYVVLSKEFCMWYPLKMYYRNEHECCMIDNWFETLDEATQFLTDELTTFSDEEILNSQAD